MQEINISVQTNARRNLWKWFMIVYTTQFLDVVEVPISKLKLVFPKMVFAWLSMSTNSICSFFGCSVDWAIHPDDEITRY